VHLGNWQAKLCLCVVFCLNLFRNGTFGDKRNTVFTERMSFLLPYQQCRNIEWNSMHRPNKVRWSTGLVLSWPTSEGRSTALVTPVLWQHYHTWIDWTTLTNLKAITVLQELRKPAHSTSKVRSQQCKWNCDDANDRPNPLSSPWSVPLFRWLTDNHHYPYVVLWRGRVLFGDWGSKMQETWIRLLHNSADSWTRNVRVQVWSSIVTPLSHH